MQDNDTARTEAVHQIYEQQVESMDARMHNDLWDRIVAVARASRTDGEALRVERTERTLTLTDPGSGRALRFDMDEVLDLPESERPGPFQMGNARVSITAWDGITRTWILRNTGAGVIDYHWVSLPGDVVVDDDMLMALVDGLRRGIMPPDPAETSHLNVSAVDTTGGLSMTGTRWAIVNLASGQRRQQDTLFPTGAAASEALKELVRQGELQEGDWEIRPVDGE